VVDDYDLLEGQPSPLRPLFPYVPTGREVGFHVVVARRSGGISRVLPSDAVISRTREVGAVSLLLSADAREGVIAGDVRGTQLPRGRGILVRRRGGSEMVQVPQSDDD
jgi:DNA segregation ATPase FtsK/SpoIIIE, S-DNA-T family